MDIKEINVPDLTSFIEECQKELINTEKIQKIEYPKALVGKSISDPIWTKKAEEIKELNKTLLSSLRNKANVYAIFVKESDDWEIKYVGQRKSLDMRERITQHLIIKSDSTNSKLEYVREAVSKGFEIGMTFIKIKKDTLRGFIEEEIISNKGTDLIWNIQK